MSRPVLPAFWFCLSLAELSRPSSSRILPFWCLWGHCDRFFWASTDLPGCLYSTRSAEAALGCPPDVHPPSPAVSAIKQASPESSLRVVPAALEMPGDIFLSILFFGSHLGFRRWYRPATPDPRPSTSKIVNRMRSTFTLSSDSSCFSTKSFPLRTGIYLIAPLEKSFLRRHKSLNIQKHRAHQ